MKEKPILFSSSMVQAILAGRKTQTRRIMKTQPDLRGPRCTNVHFEDWHGRELKFPYGWVGDILWVRETWRPSTNSMPIGWPYDYRATAKEDGVPEEGPWKPSIFMPKDACRIKLFISDIRAERLQDISEVDAINEGTLSMSSDWIGLQFPSYKSLLDKWEKGDKKTAPPIGPSPRARYYALWESINGSGSWDKNPWVWVIGFRKM
jgi:hypothetical protein